MIRMITGLPGGGKSYLMTVQILQTIKTKRKVYCNYPIPGTYKLTIEDFMTKLFPEGSLICIDEANKWLNSREWDKLPKEIFLLFTHHRHYKLDMLLVSQMPRRIDISVRELCSTFEWVSKFPRDNKITDKRALLFTILTYYSIEDLENDRNRRGKRYMLPKQSIFSKFDSYYKFVDLTRQETPDLLWDEDPDYIQPNTKPLQDDRLGSLRASQSRRRIALQENTKNLTNKLITKLRRVSTPSEPGGIITDPDELDRIYNEQLEKIQSQEQ